MAEYACTAMLESLVWRAMEESVISLQNDARLALARSVISMWPGVWVIEKGGRAALIAECGVTPHAQNTGTSSGATSVVPMPRYDCRRSSMPMSDGSPR